MSHHRISSKGAVVVSLMMLSFGVTFCSAANIQPSSSREHERHGVVELTAGFRHVCARLGSGEVRCWGDNSRGQLGTGGPGSSIRATSTGIDDAVQVIAADFSTSVLHRGGAVSCFGECFGSEDENQFSLPHHVEGLPPSRELLRHEGNRTCARVRTGEVYCWGRRQGLTKAEREPRREQDIEGASQFAATSGSVCILFRSGRVKCRGNNTHALLGDGTLESREHFDFVKNVRDAVQLGAAESNYCALQLTGSVWCWGENRLGRLGIASPIEQLEPVEVLGIRSATKIAVGGTNSYALLRDGRVACWGRCSQTRFEDHQLLRDGAVFVPNLDDAVDIVAGCEMGCALRRSGVVVCWGRDAWRLQGGNFSGGLPERHVIANLTDAAAVASGDRHTCALRRDGTVVCWGANDFGQLGLVDSTTAYGPSTVEGVTGVNFLDANGAHTCALTKSGRTLCWGAVGASQSGSQNRSALLDGMKLWSHHDDCARGAVSDWFARVRCPFINPIPVEVPLHASAERFTSGGICICAIEEDGFIRCVNEISSNGDPSSSTHRWSCTPEMETVDPGLRQLDYGLEHGCFVTEGEEAFCWGTNTNGQLGDGTVDSSSTPVQVVGLSRIAEIRAGRTHTCARLTDGSVSCWGSNENGQLGSETETPTSSRAVPVANVTDAVHLAVGSRHGCVIRDDGSVVCWGNNEMGQVGIGANRTQRGGYLVPNISDAVSVSTGAHGTCVVRESGSVECWGINAYGELGDGGALRARRRLFTVEGFEQTP